MNNKKMLFVLFFAPSTFASVNMKDASFSKTWIDAEVLQRSYSSRSLYKGYFGYGWCSNLESRITLQTEKEIVLEDCGLTSRFALKKNRDYHDVSGAKRYIKRQDKYLYFQNDLGEFKKYDLSGRLLESFNAQGSALILTYDDKGRLKSLKALASQARTDSWPIDPPPEWMIHWNEDHTRIEKIQMSPRKQIDYIYKLDDLTKVTEDQASTKFKYDNLHNMLEFESSSGEKEKLSYEPISDKVIKHSRSDGCTEEFQYYNVTEGDKRHDRSESKIKCGDSVQHAQYDFWYHKKTAGTSVLSKVRFVTDSGTQELSLKN
jgi:YD repeat-containing protein